MNEQQSVYVNQILDLQFNIYDNGGRIVDVSAIDATIAVILKRVGSSKKTFVGENITDGVNGKVHYTTLEADLDRAGLWKVQCIVTIGSAVYPSTINEFKVISRI